jgi:hypothetical protein
LGFMKIIFLKLGAAKVSCFLLVIAWHWQNKSWFRIGSSLNSGLGAKIAGTGLASLACSSQQPHKSAAGLGMVSASEFHFTWE